MNPALNLRGRAREWVAGYLPLVLMTLLALATWWLARNSPGLLPARAVEAPRHEPDYTLDRFKLQRFDATGALNLVIDGERMSHFPDDDMMEVETIRIAATTPDGRRMTATARQGRARGDGSEVWLEGAAHVISEQEGQEPITIDGEHLRAQPKLNRVESDATVDVRQGRSAFEAEGLEYDHQTRLMTLHGKARAVLAPEEARKKP